MKTFFCIAIIILTAVFVSQAQTVKNESIKIAQSGAITVDGKIEEAEWKDAAVFDLTGGGRVFFKTDGEFLFVGVRGTRKGWSHLYISQGESGDVAVMHASAALGMTVYSQNIDKLWQPSNPFAWVLRDRAITAETQKKMADYLSKNSWLANNANMGNQTDIEFQVKLHASAAKALYVAVLHTADAKSPNYFPAGLKDDTIKEELVYGNTPNDLKFDLNSWAKIVLEKKKTSQ